MKNNKNYVYQKVLHGIHDSTSHGVHNIIINNLVSHNSLFSFCFLDITHFVGIYELISKLKPVNINFNKLL